MLKHLAGSPSNGWHFRFRNVSRLDLWLVHDGYIILSIMNTPDSKAG